MNPDPVLTGSATLVNMSTNCFMDMKMGTDTGIREGTRRDRQNRARDRARDTDKDTDSGNERNRKMDTCLFSDGKIESSTHMYVTVPPSSVVFIVTMA